MTKVLTIAEMRELLNLLEGELSRGNNKLEKYGVDLVEVENGTYMFKHLESGLTIKEIVDIVEEVEEFAVSRELEIINEYDLKINELETENYKLQMKIKELEAKN